VQKENHNYAKLAAALADYGFSVMRLSDDWEGADLIAQHVDGRVLRVPLKSRLAIAKKYRGKGLYLAFPRQRRVVTGPARRDHGPRAHSRRAKGPDEYFTGTDWQTRLRHWSGRSSDDGNKEFHEGGTY